MCRNEPQPLHYRKAYMLLIARGRCAACLCARGVDSGAQRSGGRSMRAIVETTARRQVYKFAAKSHWARPVAGAGARVRAGNAVLIPRTGWQLETGTLLLRASRALKKGKGVIRKRGETSGVSPLVRPPRRQKFPPLCQSRPKRTPSGVLFLQQSLIYTGCPP